MADEHDVESIFDGGGMTPAVVPEEQARAAWETHTRAREAPAVEVEDEPATAEEVQVARGSRAPAAERPAANPADIAALQRAGWSDSDLKSLSPEAAARHALRESGRLQSQPAKTERAEEPSGPDDLERLLTEEFSSKTAKKLAPVLKAITERQTALERGVRDTSLAGLRDRHQGQYPELARPEVERAVLSIAGPAPSAEQYGRALRVLYGTRQTPEERDESRAQVDGQMTAGRRGPAPRRDPEAADRAAWAQYQKSGGNVDQAVALRNRLGG